MPHLSLVAGAIAEKRKEVFRPVFSAHRDQFSPLLSRASAGSESASSLSLSLFLAEASFEDLELDRSVSGVRVAVLRGCRGSSIVDRRSSSSGVLAEIFICRANPRFRNDVERSSFQVDLPGARSGERHQIRLPRVRFLY